jgi:hypothetical protein
MLPYLFLGALIIFINIHYYKRIESYKYGFMILVSLLFLLAIFRNITVGRDYLYYSEIFQTIGVHNLSDPVTHSILSKQEYGWYFMNKVFSLYGNFFIYVLCYYFLMYYLIFKTVYIASPWPVFSIFLYFFCGYYFTSYNAMRQVMAVSFFFFSLRYIEKGNFYKYILLLLIGGLFHLSSLFLIPLYLVRDFKWSKLFLIILLIVSLFIGYTNFFLHITPYIHIERLNHYINVMHTKISIPGYLIFALNTILGLVFIFFSHNINSKSNIYLKLTVFGLILSNLVMHFEWLFRFSDGYLVPLMIIGYVKVIAECKLYNNRVVLVSALIIYAFLMFYLNLSHNSNAILPYKLIF